MTSLPRRGSHIALIASISTLIAFTQPFRIAPAVSAGRTTQPNIVFILTDDQRFDTLWAMPTVQAELVERGVTFSNGFVVNSLCCPSRASILTGQYSHTTDVYKNSLPHGGFHSFDDSATIATSLNAGGYQTALIGKYLNQYNDEPTYIPPGWDRWVAFSDEQSGGAYYDYQLNIDGALVDHGSAEQDYSTDVLADEADAFIRRADAGSPVFLYFAPYAPHGFPVPANRHLGTFSDLELYRPPSFNEEDVSDKPAWVQDLPSLSQQEINRVDSFRRRQYMTLLAVDEAVGQIVTALDETGRLADTLIVFMSDNGYSWGDHRWSGKQAPYDEDTRVPLVIRYDPLTSSPRTDDHIALNIDLAPTFADLAGVPAPEAEGTSLLPLLSSPPADWRTDFLIEHFDEDLPTYCAVRDASAHVYIRYKTLEEEFYDLAVDPYALDNAVDDPSYATTLAGLRERLWILCDPPPPDLCTVTGTVGDDTLIGTSGDDLICGLGGDDVLQGMGGDDILVGGDGIDTATFVDSPKGVTIDLAAGTATGNGSDVLTGIENITGSTYADTLKGDGSANLIYGKSGADTFGKTGGDDTFYGGEGNDVINGGFGNDSLYGGTGDDDLFGDPGDDVLTGNKGNDDLNGGKGIDACDQGPGNGILTSCEG